MVSNDHKAASFLCWAKWYQLQSEWNVLIFVLSDTQHENVGLQVPFILPRGSSFPLLPVNPLLLLHVLFVRQVICADCNHLRRWRLLSNLGPVFETFKDWNHLRKMICDLNVKLCWCCFLKIDTHLRTTYCKFSFKATTFLSEDNNASFENWAPGVQNRFAYSAVVARNRDCRQSCSLA